MALILALAAFVVGLGIGSFVKLPSSPVSRETPNEKLLRQVEQAKKFFPSMPEMRNVSGVVKQVKDGSFVLQSDPPANPFEDLPETREVIVGDKTAIIKLEQKDPAAYQKEIDMFQKEMESASKKSSAGITPGSLPTPPNPFKEVKLALKDLKEGERVTVEAKDDIKTAERFEAVRIVVQSYAGAGGATTGGAPAGGPPIAPPIPNSGAPTGAPPIAPPLPN